MNSELESLSFTNADEMIKLEDDNYCFACGKENQQGLHLSFKYSNGRLSTEFIPSKRFQGYRDIIHGGIITTVLDEVMIQAAIAEGIVAVTAELSIRFKEPLRPDEVVLAEGEVIRKGSRLIEAHSSMIRKSDNTVIAEAYAKLIPFRQF